MSTFKIGDKVIINKETFEKVDPLHLGRVGEMYNACKKREILTITDVRTTLVYNKEIIYYQCNDFCVYNKEWLLLAEPKIPYHKDPKINAVIVKMKQLEKKFNKRKTQYEQTPF